MTEPYAITLDPPLRDLLVLQSKGKLRRTWRRLCSPRRAIPTIVVAILMLLYVAQVYIAIMFNNSPTAFPIQSIAPVGMLSILCMKLIGVCIDRNRSGAGFRHEEVHCLLGGPFSHQQVRLYRVSGHAISIFFTSVFAAVFFRFHVPSFLAALIGAYLAMLFTYLVYTTIAVAAVNVTERTYTWVRNIGCGIGLGILAYTLYQVAQLDVSSFLFLQAFGNEAIELSQTLLGRVLMSPFTVFTNIVVAETPWQWAVWIGPGLLLNYVALQLLLRTEVQLERLARLRERREFKNNREHLVCASNSETLPQSNQLDQRIPWLAGSGPIIWRQFKALSRLKGGLGWLLIPLALAFAAGGYLSYNPDEGAFQTIGVIVVLTSVFLPGLLPFDFRGDLQGLAALKMMPVNPRSVVIGQLVIPVLMLSGFQLLALSTLLLHDRELIVIILLTMCVTLPTNTIIVALENLIFLLYPYRIAEFDMQATVRRILMLMAKFCVLFLAALMSLFAGFCVLGLKRACDVTPALSRAFAAIGWPLLISAQFAALFCIAVGVVWATWWAYRRFDLSEDVPT